MKNAVENGGTIEFGGKKVDRPGYYVEPTIITNLKVDNEVVKNETFAPIVYIFEYDTIDDAIIQNNIVEQGLSSSLFTKNLSDIFKVNLIIILYKLMKKKTFM